MINDSTNGSKQLRRRYVTRELGNAEWHCFALQGGRISIFRPAASTILALVAIAFATSAIAESTEACEGKICPGIGNSFFLPDRNILEEYTGGEVIFLDREIGGCVDVTSYNGNSSREFVNSESMEEFTRKVVTQAELSGSYKSATYSAKGTAEAMTSTDSSITSTFNSTHMDIAVGTQSINFLQNSECLSEQNLDPTFLASVEALPLIPDEDVGSAASWNAYVSFLQRHGSHVMTQQVVGSRFQQWESSEEQTSNIIETLEAKACAEVEGLSATGGWSVAGCAAYSSEEKAESLSLNTSSRRLILGGTPTTRANLLQEVTQESLDLFIASAEEGTQPYHFIYMPIWSLLNSIYALQCAEESDLNNDGCDNLQRASTLQATFDGWLAVGCPEQFDASENPAVYQTMAIAGENAHGTKTYQCTVSKTGCRHNSDCNSVFRGNGRECKCYGGSCIEKGEEISGTDQFRDAIRTQKNRSPNVGVNQSCYPTSNSCVCDEGWDGGLPTRAVYLQGVD